MKSNEMKRWLIEKCLSNNCMRSAQNVCRVVNVNEARWRTSFELQKWQNGKNWKYLIVVYKAYVGGVPSFYHAILFCVIFIYLCHSQNYTLSIYVYTFYSLFLLDGVYYFIDLWDSILRQNIKTLLICTFFKFCWNKIVWFDLILIRCYSEIKVFGIVKMPLFLVFNLYNKFPTHACRQI